MAKKKPARKKKSKSAPKKRPVAAKKRPAAKKKLAAKKKPASKKKLAKKPTKRLATKPAKKPATKPAKRPTKVQRPKPQPGSPESDWLLSLRSAVEATGPDFSAFLAGLGASGWEHADSPELAGLEQWATELARTDLRAALGALVRTARYGLPIILERGGLGLDGMGFRASEPSADGAPVETQIELAAAWLDAPDQAHAEAVRAGNDPARQLQIWDEDLRPNDERAHWWYQDVGQCCGYAITRTSGSPNGGSYYTWPPETCVGRGLVLAVRGLRDGSASVGKILADVRAALVA